VSDADNCPPGSDDQSETLTQFREYRRTHDRTLRNKLIEDHLSLARTLARRFANRNEPLDDLEQVAMLGVLKAKKAAGGELSLLTPSPSCRHVLEISGVWSEFTVVEALP